MINLLAPADKKLLEQEYRRHKLVVTGVLWCLVVAAAVVVLASLYIPLHLERRDAASALTKIKQEYEAAASSTSERLILSINQQTKLVLTPSPFSPADLLERLVALRSSGIVLNKINYRPGDNGTAVAVNGVATTRQDFLRFLRNLKEEETFLAVESPVENLIRERNVRFALTLQVKP